ncbi:MAG: hypothetical protein QM303_05145, partial [Bacillota bacterium]|nr:hypothetical protein [Bacillota bacterium]
LKNLISYGSRAQVQQLINHHVRRIKMTQKEKEIDREGYEQKDIDEINQYIPFVDTKIFWKEDYGWTSRYWESLRAMGWTRAESKTEPGTVVALDENKNECLSAPDTITLLKFLTNYFLGGG